LDIRDYFCMLVPRKRQFVPAFLKVLPQNVPDFCRNLAIVILSMFQRQGLALESRMRNTLFQLALGFARPNI